MNVVEKANEVSVFGRWAAGVSQVTSPWEYSIRRNVPAYTKYITDDVTKVWSASTNLSWVLPRLGLLRDVFFKVEIDLTGNVTPHVDGGATLTPVAFAGNLAFADGGFVAKNSSTFLAPGGIAKLFSQYELRARNREIARMYPENLIHHYSDAAHHYDKNLTSLPTDAAVGGGALFSHDTERISKVNFMSGLNLYKLAALMPPDNGDANTAKSPKLTFYLEVPFSYFQRMGNALLTSFAEDITLNMICAPSLSANALGQLGNYIQPGRITVTPYYQWIQPRPEEMAKLRQQMLAAPQGIPRLQFSCLSEGSGVGPTELGRKTVEVKLNCPYPVARTLFWIAADDDKAGLTVPAYSTGFTIPIEKVEVKGSGTTFLSLDESMLLQQMVDPPFSKTIGERIIYAINWSLLDKNIEMGGFLPTRNLNNLTLAVTAWFRTAITDAATTNGANGANNRTPASYKVRVIHEYYVIEQTIPSNGQVNVTAFD